MIRQLKCITVLYRAWHRMLRNLQKLNSNSFKSHIQVNQMVFLHGLSHAAKTREKKKWQNELCQFTFLYEYSEATALPLWVLRAFSIRSCWFEFHFRTHCCHLIQSSVSPETYPWVHHAAAAHVPFQLYDPEMNAFWFHQQCKPCWKYQISNHFKLMWSARGSLNIVGLTFCLPKFIKSYQHAR